MEQTYPLPFARHVTALEYFGHTLFVIGENATRIWVLNSRYKLADSLVLFDYGTIGAAGGHSELRTTAMVKKENQPALIIMGSGNDNDQNTNVWLFPLNAGNNSQMLIPTYATSEFFRELKKRGIKKPAIDGSSDVDEQLVLGINNAGEEHGNYFLVTDIDFWQKGAASPMHLLNLQLPSPGSRVTGMEFDPGTRVLFFTAARKLENGYENFIGFVLEAPAKLKGEMISPDGFLNINKVISLSSDQKVESICFGEEPYSKGQWQLVVVTSNSDGTSYLHTLKLQSGN